MLLVPRLLVLLLAAFTTSSFLGWLLFFKEEPAEYRLKHFLLPEEYPTVGVCISVCQIQYVVVVLADNSHSVSGVS